MDITKVKCLCCGHLVDFDNTDLCYYCYFRSYFGTSKYLLFKSMLDAGNKPVTIKEAHKLEMTVIKDTCMSWVLKFPSNS